MSEKLLCPFCNETELEKGIELQGGGFILGCPKCKKFAHDVFWQELIKARKALDDALDALKEIQDKGEYVNPIDIAESALEQINKLTKGVK